MPEANFTHHHTWVGSEVADNITRACNDTHARDAAAVLLCPLIWCLRADSDVHMDVDVSDPIRGARLLPQYCNDLQQLTWFTVRPPSLMGSYLPVLTSILLLQTVLVTPPPPPPPGGKKISHTGYLGALDVP